MDVPQNQNRITSSLPKKNRNGLPLGLFNLKQLPASAQSLEVNFMPTKLRTFSAAAGNNLGIGTVEKIAISI